ncbi:MAG: hypothetical protein HY821_18180 [Acidobacteria bacterium]|nr:hypothetical protein [Acidobacteriota bacterium]
MLKRIQGLANKAFTHLRLLRDDPETFGRNVLQYTQPQLFESRLVDVLSCPQHHLHVDPDRPPALNVMQAGLGSAGMTGGPNTIVLLAALAAETGLTVRIVTHSPGATTDFSWFASHVSSLLGRPMPPTLEVVSAADSDHPATVGKRDLWLATHWTTAQAVKPILDLMHRRWFLYLIQDFEPGFYPWSSNYALSLETYQMPHRAIVNERFLADYLVERRAGLYAEAGFGAQHAIAFDPAVDRRVFYPPTQSSPGSKRRLLFYARPTNPRNLFGLGLQALRAAVRNGVFSGDWEFLSIGSRGSLPVLDLGSGLQLRPEPWAGYSAYADLLRTADLLLCPMLSPHTSYPVLEMAACGGTVVTCSYGPKSAAALAALSPDILGVPPTSQGLLDGLAAAAQLAGKPKQDRLQLPASWDDVLPPIVDWVVHNVNGVDWPFGGG